MAISESGAAKVGALVRRILGAGAKWPAIAEQMVWALFNKWRVCPEESLSNEVVRQALGRQTGDTASVRLAAATIRKKLNAYFSDNPGEFLRIDLPKRSGSGYRLSVWKHSPSEERVRLIFNSRNETREWFEEVVRGPSSDVLYVSVSSSHTLEEIGALLKDGAVHIRHFRVLTWLPHQKCRQAVLRAFSELSGDVLTDLKLNVRNAWKKWKELEQEYECLEVYSYSSVPTLQAICDAKSRSMKVEFLPFNRAGKKFHTCGSPARRPALLLNEAENPSSFGLFKHVFEDLWLTAIQNANEEDVADRWRGPRHRILRHLMPRRSDPQLR